MSGKQLARKAMKNSKHNERTKTNLRLYQQFVTRVLGHGCFDWLFIYLVLILVSCFVSCFLFCFVN